MRKKQNQKNNQIQILGNNLKIILFKDLRSRSKIQVFQEPLQLRDKVIHQKNKVKIRREIHKKL